ncbi:MAG: APC family permease [Erysipelotrichaceae bacterium]|nr:APC family permease [Erysipelotrichaceae bacterium]
MKCPNCSGTLYYDIKNHNLKCRSCSSEFDLDKYQVDADAEELVFEDARFYTCKSCGAQLISGDDRAVDYCSYCGSEAILESNLTGVKKPKYIIPFRVTKSRCKQIYSNELKNKIYVPKEFKDPDFIDRFRPFYIPYWLYQVKFRDDEFTLDGYRNYTRGGYDYHEEYKIQAEIRDQGVYGLPYDASRNFDDTIAEDIAPFNRKDLTEYRPGYLAGMYADAPNVDAKLYEEEVLENATEAVIGNIKDSVGHIINLKLPMGKKRQDLLQARYDHEDTLFLPVWFLTWKKGNRVAYAVVNGQTGKIHIDLPADVGQFILYTLAGTVALFVLLTLFVTVTSRFVLWFAALLVYIVSVRYYKELKEIRDRENHVFDKGYLISDEDDLEMSERKRERLRKRSKSILGKINTGATMVLTIMGIGFLFIFAFSGLMYDILVTQTAAIGMTFFILFLQFFRFLKTLSVSRHLKNKWSFLFALIAFGAVVYSFLVAAAEPVQDWWYYLGGLICLFAASLMAIDLITRFNESSTRPLPSFYTRKGGNDSAKEI